MTPPPLSEDERRIVLHLISGALADMAFSECPAGHPRVAERLALAEVLLRGDHRPRPRRHRRTRPVPSPMIP